MKNKIIFALICLSVFSNLQLYGAQNQAKNEKSMDAQAREFVKYYESKIAPLEKAGALAKWEASVTGKDEDYKTYAKCSLEINKFLSNKENFEKVKAFRQSSCIKDPVIKRCIEVIYLECLPKQIDETLLKQIVDAEKDAEKTFSIFRGEIDGKEITTNKVYEILGSSDDVALRQKAWEASQQVGEVVAPKLIELIKLRNKAAKQLGFKNYYSMMLKTQEYDENELMKTFDNLAALTSEPFRKLKNKTDAALAKKHHIQKDEVMVWNYADPYFQEAPNISESIDIDVFFKDKEVIKVISDFYGGINLPIDDILKRSSLYEAKGKEPHAYCADIDRGNDIRMLLNMKNNAYWAAAMLHVAGRAGFDKHISKNLPWTLRVPAHISTSEAIGEMFGRLSKNPYWLNKTGFIPEEKVKELNQYMEEKLRLEMLIFARWSQVMTRFEKALYENPDQDLNKLWWALKEKYQFVKTPANRNKPDWAAKIHFTKSPVYYHNYLIGEMVASQLIHKMGVDILKVKNWSDIDFVNQPKLGDWLKKNIFEPGAKYEWNDLIKRATGEKLNPKYYAEQIIK